MTVLARLYTEPEIIDVQNAVPLSVTDARFQLGLAQAVQWAALPSTHCAVCDTPLHHVATYLIVLLPADPELGLGCSGAVCQACGTGLPRDRLEAYALTTATLMFAPVGGHA